MRNSFPSSVQEQQMKAAVDLLRHVPNSTPRRVAYLRHGPEPTAELLVRRFPNAEVVGIEYSQVALDLSNTRRINYEAHNSEVDPPPHARSGRQAAPPGPTFFHALTSCRWNDT